MSIRFFVSIKLNEMMHYLRIANTRTLRECSKTMSRWLLLYLFAWWGQSIAVEYIVLVQLYLQWDQPVIFHFLTVKYPLTMFEQNFWAGAKRKQTETTRTYTRAHFQRFIQIHWNWGRACVIKSWVLTNDEAQMDLNFAKHFFTITKQGGLCLWLIDAN